MANYLIQYGATDLSDIIEEMSVTLDNELDPRIIPGRHGLIVNSIVPNAIRIIKMRGRIFATSPQDLRNQVSELAAELGTARDELYVGLDDKFFYAWKRKFNVTPITGSGLYVGLVDIEFVCDDPNFQDATEDLEIDYFRNIQLVQANGGSLTSEDTGFTFASIFGQTSVAKVWDSDGQWVQCNANGNGLGGGMGPGTNPVGNVDGATLRQRIDFYAKFKTGSSVANMAYFIGMIHEPNQVWNDITDNFGGQELIGLVCDNRTDVGIFSGDFYALGDRDTGSITTFITGVPLVADTVYEMRIDMREEDVIHFYINGDEVAEFESANLPVDTTKIGAMVQFHNQSNGVPNRHMYFGRMIYEYD